MVEAPGKSVPAVLDVDELQPFLSRSPRAFWPAMVLLVTLFILFTVYFSRVHTKPTVQMGWIPYAAQHFADDGYFHHRFTPPFPDIFSNLSASDHTVWYTHYPPLPYYVAGVIWKLGGTSKFALAVFFNAIALAYLLLFYTVVSLILNNRIACIATIVQAVHAIFIAQCLENYLNLSLFFQAAAFLFLILALEIGRPRRRILFFGAAWLCLFCDAFSTYDQLLASSFFVFAYTFWRLGLKNWRKATLIVAILATASITAFLTHLLTNAWFFGSFDMAFDDLCVKTFSAKSVGETPFGDVLSLKDYPGWLLTNVWNYYGLVKLGVLSVSAALIWAFVSWGRSSLIGRRYFTLLGILFICNSTYWVVFAKLNYAQFQWVNGAQMLPTFSLMLSGSIYFMWLKIALFWKRGGRNRILILVPELIFLGCLSQAEEVIIQSVHWMNSNTAKSQSAKFVEWPIHSALTQIKNEIPVNSIVALAEVSAFRNIQRLRPASAYGSEDFPFSIRLVTPSDKNALFKLESIAQTGNVYFLLYDTQPVINDNFRKAFFKALVKEGVDESEFETRLQDCGPTTIRPNWSPVFNVPGHTLYKISTPEKDDLFPERAGLPTRMAISGVRIRDNNELQVTGWLFSSERITKIELHIGDTRIGSAMYPVPDVRLAHEMFTGIREWYGMQDWPLPEENIVGDYPEYGDNTSRFTLIKYYESFPFPLDSRTIRADVYSADRLVISGEFALTGNAGRIKLADALAIVSPPPEHLPIQHSRNQTKKTWQDEQDSKTCQLRRD